MSISPKENQLIQLTCIYQKRDEVQCTALTGQSLYQVAIKHNIQMNDKYMSTCLVQIQSSQDKSGNFYETVLSAPTAEELKNLTAAQIRDGFRFAHTYMVNAHLARSIIFLNLVRISYVDSGSKSHALQAYTGESMLSLRERNQSIIDLSFSCHGALACSTCHCILDVSDSVFNRLGEISEEEEDILQFCNPQKHSRLGCQIFEFKPEFDQILHFRNPRAKSNV
jgi:ferredoxin